MLKNILIVDDDSRLRDLLKDYLNEKNFTVYLCDDFNNAKEIIQFFKVFPIAIIVKSLI